MIDAFVALGSNLNDPVEQLKRAVEEIRGLAQSTLEAVSSFYQTPPWGKTDQPDFINAVLKIKTQLSAATLMDLFLGLENKHQRQRKEKWEPRTLDCDLILYGQEVINEERLIVPHPGMKTRAFVLLPLFEIAPDVLLPTGEKIADLLVQCDCTGIQKLC